MDGYRIREQKKVEAGNISVLFENEKMLISKISSGKSEIFRTTQEIVLSMEDLEKVLSIVRAHAIVKEFSKPKTEEQI